MLGRLSPRAHSTQRSARVMIRFHIHKASQVKSRFALLGGKKAICRGGGPQAQGLVRAGVVPTTPRKAAFIKGHRK